MAKVFGDHGELLEALPIENGGTGATSLSGAKTALGIASALSLKTLWINSSPASDFATQTISLSENSMNYNFIAIEFLSGTTSNEVRDVQIFKPVSSPIGYHASTMSNATSSSIEITRRGFLMNAKTIAFQDAKSTHVGADSAYQSTANAYMKPVAVYGVKVG